MKRRHSRGLEPPRLPARLLSLVIRGGEKRACFLGDLQEEFQEIRERRGWTLASIWYWGVVLEAVVRCALEAKALRNRHTSNGPRRIGGMMTMGSMGRDIGLAARHWARSPGFTTAAALTVAIGIGATTTVFSVADSLLARTPSGVQEPGSLVSARISDVGDQRSHFFSYPEYEEYRDADNGLEQLSALDIFPATIGTGFEADPELVSGMAVSAAYFSILGTRAYLGRFFLPEEDVPGEPAPVVVLSYRFWMHRMGGDPSVVGRTVSLNRTPFTVIGVAQEGFRGHVTAYDFSVWIPTAMAGTVTDIDLKSRGVHRFSLIGRLAPGTSLGQARAAADLVSARMRSEHPAEMEGRSISLEPYSIMFEEARGPVTLFMALFFALSGTILLIASVNVGGMLLASAVSRRREVAVRLALGAPRRAIVQQLMAESLLLFLLAGGGGALLAYWATRILGAMDLPTPIPVVLDLRLDGPALVFTLVCALVTGVVFGLAPALRATRVDIRSALSQERAGQLVGGGRLRSTFVVAQVAGSLVLLAAAGVLARGLGRAADVDLGLEPTGVHVMSFDLAVLQYSEEESVHFLRELQARAAVLPGVEHTAVAQVLPLRFSSLSTVVDAPGQGQGPGDGGVETDLNRVTPDFFSTLEIPFLVGQTFDATESSGVTEVVVNRTAATRLWPGESALGKSLHILDRQATVVGVVANGKYRTLGEAPRAMIYVPLGRRYTGELSLVVRVAPGASPVSRDLRDIVRDLEPDLPINTNAPYARLIGISLLPNRAAAGGAAVFGMVGLLLATIGLYGVLSYTVGQRTREMGIRMALGADTGLLRGAVLRDGIRLVAVGLLVGSPFAAGATWLLRTMLYGLSPVDPVTFASLTVLLVVVGAVASYLPARRVTRVNPVQALRCE